MPAESGVSTEIVPPPMKKLKVDTDTVTDEAVAEAVTGDDSDSYMYLGRKFRKPNSKDPEYVRQYKELEKQFERSEGFEINWDQFDYPFRVCPITWLGSLENMSNDELLRKLAICAIDEHNEEEETHLEFVKNESANIMPCKGFVYWITFWAKDMSSPNPEPRRYQTKVWQFNDEIEVDMLRLRPTDEEITSNHGEPPSHS